MNYQTWIHALRGRTLPVAAIDLDALEHNLAILLAARSRPNVTLRVASKSLRVRGLISYLHERGGGAIHGVMAYSAMEACWLARQGTSDILMGYPLSQPDEAQQVARACAEGHRIIPTVDAPEHVALLDDAARACGVTLPICLDIDMSLRGLGGRVHLGVRRSPLRLGSHVRALARRVADASHLHVHALLAYEAQVAGMADHNPHAPLLDPIKRWIKSRSVGVAVERRAAVLQALIAAGDEVRIVNGGGTGSVATTSADPSVTEVTVGSGFLCPHLFDGYDGLALEPAAFFAIPVVRSSDPGFVTCAGGGLIASGAVGPDRAPRVHLPQGLAPTSLEGWGEVQTPFDRTLCPLPLGLGSPVIARHAKAGELFERFSRVLLLRGGEIVDDLPTYRGEGQCFG